MKLLDTSNSFNTEFCFSISPSASPASMYGPPKLTPTPIYTSSYDAAMRVAVLFGDDRIVQALHEEAGVAPFQLITNDAEWTHVARCAPHPYTCVGGVDCPSYHG